MHKLWTPKDQRLIERLKENIVSGPTLEILYPLQSFYIKAYLSNDEMV